VEGDDSAGASFTRLALTVLVTDASINLTATRILAGGVASLPLSVWSAARFGSRVQVGEGVTEYGVA
jgi:hypothetical protein